MILSAQSIRKRQIVIPFSERTVSNGLTYGLSACGYDVRIAQTVCVGPFCVLASTIERFEMPDDIVGKVHDKSTWARQGLTVQNTIIEPGWRGHLTLELVCHNRDTLWVREGSPIAQIVFETLDEPSEIPYTGKYQDQPDHPVKAILE